ncbi:UNVERIFIED_CONTAM: hypothetical protein K2H54_000963 [Gekko kuhli]
MLDLQVEEEETLLTEDITGMPDLMSERQDMRPSSAVQLRIRIFELESESHGREDRRRSRPSMRDDDHRDPPDAGDYQKFKALTLQQFALSSETYWRAFWKMDRSLLQGSFHAAAATHVQNPDRWLNAEGVSTFYDLRELILLEQFYHLLPDELSALVKYWDPVSIDQAANLAQRMRQHREKALGKSAFAGDSAWPAIEKTSKAAETQHGTPAKKPSTSPTATIRPRVDPKSGLCFYCKQGDTKKLNVLPLKLRKLNRRPAPLLLSPSPMYVSFNRRTGKKRIEKRNLLKLHLTTLRFFLSLQIHLQKHQLVSHHTETPKDRTAREP